MSQGTLDIQGAEAYASAKGQINMLVALKQKVLLFSDKHMPGIDGVPNDFVYRTSLIPRSDGRGGMITTVGGMLNALYPEFRVARSLTEALVLVDQAARPVTKKQEVIVELPE